MVEKLSVEKKLNLKKAPSKTGIRKQSTSVFEFFQRHI